MLRVTSTKTFLTSSFRPNIYILSLGGLWLPEKPYLKIIASIHCFLSYIFFTCPLPFLTIINNIISKPKFVEIVNNSDVILEVSASVFKVAIAIWKRKQVRECILSLNTRKFHRNEDNKHLIWAVKSCKILAWSYAICCGSSCTFIIYNIINFKTRQLPMDVWLPYDIQKVSYFTATLTNIWLSIGMLTHPLLNATLDTLLSNLLTHATAQTRILKDNILNLHKDENGQDEFHDSRILKKISKCVDHFDDIADFVSNCQEIFGFMPFVQLLFSAAVVCGSVYKITILGGNRLDEVLPITFFLMTILMEVLLYCWYGEEIVQETKTLNDVIYFAKWYEFGPKSKKALITFMERAKRPLILQAGGFFSLNLFTFTMVLRYSYSLLAVLKSQAK